MKISRAKAREIFISEVDDTDKNAAEASEIFGVLLKIRNAKKHFPF